tara:strand:+ start:23705 stop:24373 length:669 start_codon:yes stop_codon:yes gene_type:complete
MNNLIKFLFFLYFLFFPHNVFGFHYKPVHEFEIYRNNKKIGFHKLFFQSIEDKIIVNTEIKMVVKIGIIPVFNYIHKAEEVWINDKFIKAETSTKKNNRSFKLEAYRKENKIEIKSNKNIFVIDENSLITSYWHRNWLKKKVLFDSQHGKKRLINIEKKNFEEITTANGSIFAQKYKVTGTQDKPNGKKIDYNIWYDEKGRWVKISFFIKKSFIEYYLVTKY